jgi:hypothetical protein
VIKKRSVLPGWLVCQGRYYDLCCLLQARVELPRSPRLSGKPYSRVRVADLPGYKRELSLRKLVIYLGVCWERFRCPRATHLRISLGLYDVSVRSLATWTRMWRNRVPRSLDQHIRRLPLHGSSPPRSCPRLVLSIGWLHLVYCPPSNSQFRTGDLHPTSSRPCRAYRFHPSPPSGRSKLRIAWGGLDDRWAFVHFRGRSQPLI